MIGHHRMRAEQPVLRHILVHPGAAALVAAGVVVADEHGELLAVLVEHVPHAHVWVVHRQIVALLEAQAVELVGGEEHAVGEHIVQLEVRAQLRFIELVLGLAHLLGVVGPVPGGELEAALLGVDQLLHVGCLLPGVGHGRRGEVIQQLVHRRGGLGGLVLQHVAGVVGVAQQLGAFGAQPGQLGHHLAVVELAAVAAAVERGVHQLFAQGAALQRRQRRLARGVLQGEQVLAVELLCLGRLGRRGDRVVGQTLEVVLLVHHDSTGVGFLEQLLAELGLQRGELRVEILQLGLVGVVELGAGADEIGVVAPQQALAFGVEAELVALVVQRLHAREQLAVQRDGVLVRRQLRRHFGLHLLQCVIGVAAGQIEEHGGHAVEQLTGLLQRHDGVVEARRLLAVGNRRHLRQLFGHALLEGRREITVLDLVELRVLEGQRALGEERIAYGHGGGLGRLLRLVGEGGGGKAERQRHGAGKARIHGGLRSGRSRNAAQNNSPGRRPRMTKVLGRGAEPAQEPGDLGGWHDGTDGPAGACNQRNRGCRHRDTKSRLVRIGRNAGPGDMPRSLATGAPRMACAMPASDFSRMIRRWC